MIKSMNKKAQHKAPSYWIPTNHRGKRRRMSKEAEKAEEEKIIGLFWIVIVIIGCFIILGIQYFNLSEGLSLLVSLIAIIILILIGFGIGRMRRRR
jgi:predicted permease